MAVQPESCLVSLEMIHGACPLPPSPPGSVLSQSSSFYHSKISHVHPLLVPINATLVQTSYYFVVLHLSSTASFPLVCLSLSLMFYILSANHFLKHISGYSLPSIYRVPTMCQGLCQVLAIERWLEHHVCPRELTVQWGSQIHQKNYFCNQCNSTDGIVPQLKYTDVFQKAQIYPSLELQQRFSGEGQ